MPQISREPPQPGIRRVTVRFTGPMHRSIEENAHRQGITIAQYIREAAILRQAWEDGIQMGRSSDDWETFLGQLSRIRALMDRQQHGEE